MAKSISFDLVQNSVKLQGKSHGHTSLSARVFIFVVRFITVAALGVAVFRVSRMIVVIVNHKVTIVHLGRLAGFLRLATTLGAGLFAHGTVVVANHGGRSGSGKGGGFRLLQLKGSHQPLGQARRHANHGGWSIGRLLLLLLSGQGNWLLAPVRSVGNTHGKESSSAFLGWGCFFLIFVCLCFLCEVG